MTKWNEPKLKRLIVKADQLHAAWRHAQDAYLFAKTAVDDHKQNIRIRSERHPDHKSTERDAAELQRLEAEMDARQGERDAAGEKWRSVQRIAARCEEYARTRLGWAPEPAGVLHGAMGSIRGGGL